MRYSYAPLSEAAHVRGLAAVPAAPAGAPGPLVLRPAQPYDLATPGTPAGIRAVARAAEAGGGWRAVATFALARLEGGAGAVVASLALRLLDLAAPLPQLRRRAWCAYTRGEDGGWTGAGAALLDPLSAVRPLRPIGIEELKALLRREAWAPPIRLPATTMPCPDCDTEVRVTKDGKIYASHRCAETATEGER